MFCLLHSVMCYIACLSALFHGSTSAYDTAFCDEDPQPCSYQYNYYDDFNSLFETREHGRVSRHTHTFHVDGTQSLCSIDPFKNVRLHPSITERMSIADIHFQVFCAVQSTRIVLRPSMNLTDTNAFSYLVFHKCTVYWKDLSLFGQLIDTYVLRLFDSRDEFVNDETHFFYECVDYEDNWNSSGNTVYPTVRGLGGLDTLAMTGSFHSGLHPLLLNNSWPSLTEVALDGVVITEDEYNHLEKTMPVLQELELHNSGGPIFVNLTFPWYPDPMVLPLGLFRTNDFNHAYSESIGIAPLELNLCRRLLILNGFNLADLRNTRFTGFLHKIDLGYNDIQVVDEHTFTGITDLEALALNNNMLTVLPEHFLRGLTELRTFEIENNLLTYIHSKLFFNLQKLARISLKGNFITHILDHTFSGLHGLNTLDVSNNSLQHIGDKAIDTNCSSYMERMYFSDNNLTYFPTFLLSLRRLWIIDLSSNWIDFKGLKKSLSRISSPMVIQQANVARVSGGILKYKPCAEKSILLCNNRLEEFDISSLSALEGDSFKLMLNFFHLKLDGNTLLCSCRMFEFHKYLLGMETNAPRDYSRLGVAKYNLEHIACELPSKVAGTPVAKVDETIFGCVEDVPDCPQNCSCWVRTVDRAVFVDCQKQNKTELPELLPKNSIELNFAQNNLTKLPCRLPTYVSKLEKINFSKNYLKDLNGDIIPQLCVACHVLLYGNELETLPNEIGSLSPQVKLTLSGNKFSCDCFTNWMKQWLLTHRHQILDIDRILCASGQPQMQVVIEVPDADFVCLAEDFMVVASVGSLAGLFALFLIMLIPAYRYRGEIKIILFMRFGWHPFDRTEDVDILDKDYDAFVSYSHEDYAWVVQELRPYLEDEDPAFRLCLHDRDFMAGAAVADNICSAVNISRRMVLVLSKAFLRSHWCHLEFRQAHYKVLKDRTNYLIVVLCEDVSSEDLDEDLKMYLNTYTYINRDSRWFWQKLRYAMPQRPLRELKQAMGQNVEDRCLIEVVAGMHHDDVGVEEGEAGDLRPQHCCQYRGPENGGRHLCARYRLSQNDLEEQYV